MAFTQEDFDWLFGAGATIIQLPQDHHVTAVMEDALDYAYKTSRNPKNVQLSDFEVVRVASADPNQKSEWHVAAEINQVFKNRQGAVKQSSESAIMRNGEVVANELVAFADKARETET